MTTDTQSILCGACRVPLEGPAEPQPQDMFSCPACGRSDTLENIFSEVKTFVTEMAKRRLQESLRKVARGSKVLKFEGKPIPKRTYRFITDHKI